MIVEIKNNKVKINASYLKDPNWKKGQSGKYKWEAKVYDEPSDYGINRGRVSKLYITDTKTGEEVVNYDRGWDTGEDKKSIWSPIVSELERS